MGLELERTATAAGGGAEKGSPPTNGCSASRSRPTLARRLVHEDLLEEVPQVVVAGALLSCGERALEARQRVESRSDPALSSGGGGGGRFRPRCRLQRQAPPDPAPPGSGSTASSTFTWEASTLPYTSTRSSSPASSTFPWEIVHACEALWLGSWRLDASLSCERAFCRGQSATFGCCRRLDLKGSTFDFIDSLRQPEEVRRVGRANASNRRARSGCSPGTWIEHHG